MGVVGLPALLNDDDTPKSSFSNFANHTFEVDVMGTFFALLRALYFSCVSRQAADTAKLTTPAPAQPAPAQPASSAAFNLANLSWSTVTTAPAPAAAPIPPYLFIARALDQKLSRIGLSKATTRLHFDGARSSEKQHEHQRRQSATAKQMAALDKFFVDGQQIPLRKPNIEAVGRAAKNVIHIPQAVRRAIAGHMQNLGWIVHHYPFESDPCIARMCAPTSYVLSNDSDLIVYRNIEFVVRQVWGEKNKFQLFRRSQMLAQYQMTSDEWLLLGIVTNNDYNIHFEGNGISTNREIIRDLKSRLRGNGNMTSKVQTYIREVTGLSDPFTSGQASTTAGQYVWDFTNAISVFERMVETAETGNPLAPVIDYNARVQNRLVQLERYKIVQRRNRALQQQQPQPQPQPQRPFTKYKSVRQPGEEPRYNPRLIGDFSNCQSKMPAAYLATDLGRKIKVVRRKPAAKKRKPAASSKKKARGSAKKAPAAPTGPKRVFKSHTIMKKKLDSVFMTSTLSVGCLKAQLRFTTDPSKRALLSDAEREEVAFLIQTLVATLNTIRQHMFKAILLYIATTVHQFPGAGAGTADKNSRSRWLDPLVNKARMASICQNLCSMLAGTSQLLGAGQGGDSDGDDGDGGDGAKGSDDDDGDSDDSSASSKRRRIAAAGPSTSGPAQAGSSRGRGASQGAASGSAPGSRQASATRARKTPAKGKGKARAGDGAGDGGDGDGDGGDGGDGGSRVQDNRDIAMKMYELLVQVLGPLALVPESPTGFKVDSRAREQMCDNVADLVSRHFVELWPLLNEKAAEHNQVNFAGTIDPQNVSKDDLVFMFWRMNDTLPVNARMAYCPNAALTNTFMMLSEETLLHQLWPKAGRLDLRPNRTRVRLIMDKILSRGEAERLVKEHGTLTRILFFGEPAATANRRPPVSSYRRKLITTDDLMRRMNSTGGIQYPLSPESLVAHKQEVKDYNKRRKTAKEAGAPFDEPLPALPSDPTLPQFYVPTGMIRTNGLELQIFAYDLRKRCPPPSKYRVPETSAGIKDISQWETAADIQAALGDAYLSMPVVGIDPGEVVTAAGCGIHILPGRPNTVSNLTIKRTALYAPILRARYALNLVKKEPLPIPNLQPAGQGPLTAPSINDWQNQILGLADGSRQSAVNHVATWGSAYPALRDFYGSNAYRKNNCARRKAFRAEYDWAVTGLLKLGLDRHNAVEMRGVHMKVGVGGGKKTLFVYGDAKFNTRSRLASLYTSFQGYFYKKATALGHAVVVADEFRTSSICPSCDAWVAKPSMRACFCVNAGCNRTI
ncbi:hypothetical protein EC968_006282 [Mortierella alpina]|nr:hypothetical protein EC968_006282 [Mortierella alpina]